MSIIRRVYVWVLGEILWLCINYPVGNYNIGCVWGGGGNI